MFAKIMVKKQNRDIIKAARIERTAQLHGVSKRYVRLVLQGERNNEDVFATYMTYAEQENKLLDVVRRLVPFNK
jgi:hypothetical protein